MRPTQTETALAALGDILATLMQIKAYLELLELTARGIQAQLEKQDV